MIYTVTLNPSIDYYLALPALQLGTVNRASGVSFRPGGKGINVSQVLRVLGYASCAMGFLAGETGDMLAQMLQRRGLRTDFIPLTEGNTRMNIKLNSEQETAINASGPKIPIPAFLALSEKLNALRAGDILVLAGALPPGVPKDAYAALMGCVEKQGIHTIVDAEGEYLEATFPKHPFLIKPNGDELAALTGQPITDHHSALLGAQLLQQRGARNILVSLGSQGGVLLCENGVAYQAQAVQGDVVSTVGAGDAMIAGFLAGYLRGGDFAAGFAFGLAAGSANAFDGELTDKKQLERFLPPPYSLDDLKSR